jgi:murein DD-endopeptidase MepM/ murein hydrolase activator NlpD
MDIILVSDRLAKARTFSITLPQLALLALVGIGCVIALTTTLNYVVLRYALDLKLPYVQNVLGAASHEDSRRADTYVRENVNAMAVRLGQMQAELLRLDTLGERLAKLAGFRPQDLMFGQTPGQGGALPASKPMQDLSLSELKQQLEALSQQVEDRGDKLAALESLFTLDNARKKLVPSMPPVRAEWRSSSYGWRIDPFTGQRAFHEGIDFMAEMGAPIHAAAGGVVVFSDFHPQYGNMVEIDHGNGLVSRYAHASRRLVKAGDVVLSGAKIAEVGRTGRATGTHLHFEVRLHGVPQNPSQFLRQPG